jgi:hypothetical protein
VLIRRVEAGDVPARRSEGPEGPQYSVRLSDLGFGAATAETEPPPAPETVAADPDVELVGSARLPTSWPDKVVPPPSEELAAVSGHAPQDSDPNGGHGSDRPAPVATRPQEAPASRPANGAAPERASAAPPRQQQASGDVSLITGSPRGEVANMALDPRELVAGLLDRWERTLEQRIYSEQRQRFETELNSRQNLLKQLQLELQAARAEHAAAQADKDRRLAEREREVTDLQRELSSTREPIRKRSWFHRG